MSQCFAILANLRPRHVAGISWESRLNAFLGVTRGIKCAYEKKEEEESRPSFPPLSLSSLSFSLLLVSHYLSLFSKIEIAARISPPAKTRIHMYMPYPSGSRHGGAEWEGKWVRRFSFFLSVPFFFFVDGCCIARSKLIKKEEINCATSRGQWSASAVGRHRAYVLGSVCSDFRDCRERSFHVRTPIKFCRLLPAASVSQSLSLGAPRSAACIAICVTYAPTLLDFARVAE